MDLVIDEASQRQAHIYGDFGALHLTEPNRCLYGLCEHCGAARRARRQVLDGEHIHWDLVCSRQGCISAHEPIATGRTGGT